MAKIVTDNYMYAKVVKYVKSRKDLTEDMLEGLEEILMDSSIAQAVMEASRCQWGWTFLQLILSAYSNLLPV